MRERSTEIPPSGAKTFPSGSEVIQSMRGNGASTEA